MSRKGPRREHTRDEFLTLLLDAAEEAARRDGPEGLGMRRLAAAIGYAPNSIYNAVGDLDEIVWRLNARTLSRLRGHLEDLLAEKRSLRAKILRLADGFLDFAAADPHLWRLLFEKTLTPGGSHTEAYADNLRAAVALMEQSLEPLIEDPTDRRRAVVALWSTLHGLASLAAAGRLEVMSRDDPRRLARVLIGAFVQGLSEPKP